MGGAVSSGRNNDDLIDNLLEADYIKTSLIERVFRAVDRAEYFLPEARCNAYKDIAWKSGNLHISAPCIYSEVMEGLSLQPGASFLNLGSGTGYLSTMVGLILGTNGINHGIELHEDVIEYATKKLEDFKKHSGAIDEYDFCEPKFVQGNCLCLTSESTAFYDRIYCGAACPEQFESYMKSLLKIGGILVMPINDQLLQIRRLSETAWRTKTLLPVSFALLVMPPDGFQEFVKPIEVEPLSLQILCRAVVRNILRKNVEKEHPPVKRPPPAKAPKKKRTLKRLVVPLFDDEESSDDERQVRLGGERNRDAGRAVFRRDDDGIFSFILGIGNRRGSGDRDRSNSNRKTRETRSRQEAMETDSNTTEDNSNIGIWRLKPNITKTESACFHLNNHHANYQPNIQLREQPLRCNKFPKYLGITLDRSLTYKQHLISTAAKIKTRNNIIHKMAGTNWGADATALRTSSLALVYSVAEYCSPVFDENASGASEPTSHQVRAVIEHHLNPENTENNNENIEECLGTINEISDVIVECLDLLRSERASLERDVANMNNESNENEENEHNEGNTEERKENSTNKNSDTEENVEEARPSTSAPATKKSGKREKFDSGLGDEIIEAQDSSDDDDNMKLDAISSCDEDYTSEKRHKRDSSSDTEEELKEADNEMRMYESPYTEHMREKIQQLPLPPILKKYLNYYRDIPIKNKEE